MDDIEVSSHNRLKSSFLESLHIPDDLIIKIQFITQHLGSIGSHSSIREISVDDFQLIDTDLGDPSVIMKQVMIIKGVDTDQRSEFFLIKDSGTCISRSGSGMSQDIVIIR